MTKNKLLLISLIVVFLIAFGFYFLKSQTSNIQPFGPLETKEEVKKRPLSSYQRQNLTFLKFVSSENCMYSLDDSEIAELKSLNVNGIRICPLYSKRDGEMREDIPSSVVINSIRKAHDAGFAVFLEINAGGKPTESGMPEYQYDNLEDIDNLYNTALHWAEIAEEEKVEFYSPLNEPDIMFTSQDLLDQWINESQNLKSVFLGNLVLKFADIGPEKIEDIENYDYLAFDIMWGDAQYQELRNHFKMAVEKGNSLKKQYNLKGFFFGELGAERSRVDKNVQAQLFKIILEETWGKVDGYCFLGWSDLEFKFRDNNKAKETIKEWYSKRE